MVISPDAYPWIALAVATFAWRATAFIAFLRPWSLAGIGSNAATLFVLAISLYYGAAAGSKLNYAWIAAFAVGTVLSVVFDIVAIRRKAGEDRATRAEIASLHDKVDGLSVTRKAELNTRVQAEISHYVELAMQLAAYNLEPERRKRMRSEDPGALGKWEQGEGETILRVSNEYHFKLLPRIEAFLKEFKALGIEDADLNAIVAPKEMRMGTQYELFEIAFKLREMAKRL